MTLASQDESHQTEGLPSGLRLNPFLWLTEGGEKNNKILRPLSLSFHVAGWLYIYRLTTGGAGENEGL